MRRIIREEEPPKPSTRLSSLGETLTTVSANRKADARHLDRAVRGELDWIVMKALEKDRRRRYETANDFAADVMRYLTDQPVEACPPSAWYRFTQVRPAQPCRPDDGGVNRLDTDRGHGREHLAGSPGPRGGAICIGSEQACPRRRVQGEQGAG